MTATDKGSRSGTPDWLASFFGPAALPAWRASDAVVTGV